MPSVFQGTVNQIENNKYKVNTDEQIQELLDRGVSLDQMYPSVEYMDNVIGDLSSELFISQSSLSITPNLASGLYSLDPEEGANYCAIKIKPNSSDPEESIGVGKGLFRVIHSLGQSNLSGILLVVPYNSWKKTSSVDFCNDVIYYKWVVNDTQTLTYDVTYYTFAQSPDQTYDGDSANAQSGKAVAKAVQNRNIFKFNSVGDGTSRLYECLAKSATQIIIPNELEGQPVSIICNNAFKDCSSLTSIVIPNSVVEIMIFAFNDCVNLTDIYYKGTQEEWDEINISQYNDPLKNATKHYNYIAPTNEYYTKAQTEVFTTVEKTKLAGIETGAEVNEPVDQNYNPTSENAQSGKAVTEGLDSKADKNRLLNYISYTKSSNRVAITGLKSGVQPADLVGDFVIPETIEGYSVTEIASRAFYDCIGLTSVIIPDSVISINANAFNGCTNLTSIIITDSVTSIGNFAFSGCANLTSITIPNNITSISNYTFSDCTGFTNITIPDSVTSIGNYAFNYCTGLISITIPDSVIAIGEYTFNQCNNITTIYYSGTEAQWNNIIFGTGNDYIRDKHIPLSAKYTETPTFASNTYYAKVDNDYVLLANKPIDWDSNWGNYYVAINFHYNQKPAYMSSVIVKQDSNDNNLTTTNKTVVGAINELNSNKANTSAMQAADNNLQSQIDAITSASDVVDVVADYTALENYDPAKLTNDDIVKVLSDNSGSHNGATTYYRWVINSSYPDGIWQFVGEVGPYYTKSETNTLLGGKVDINSFDTLSQSVSGHISNTNNPHNVTKTQVGLGNVDNTADADKPISTATQVALDLKADKSATYTKNQTDEKIGEVQTAEFKYVENLPATGEGNTLYLTPRYSYTPIEIQEAAKFYVEKYKNEVTPVGFISAIQEVEPNATLDTVNNFYIKHAVPGVKDDTSDYPLNIEGSDGVVVATFIVNGERISISVPFEHETELLHISETAIVGTSSGFTYDASGNVTAYSGTADKIVFPAGYSGTMTNLADKTSAQNIKVLIYNNGVAFLSNAFSNWDGIIAVQIDNGDTSFSLASSVNSRREAYMFANCDNLKYFKFPKKTINSFYWNALFPNNFFENSAKLETIIWPASFAGMVSTNIVLGYRPFYGVAVREYNFPIYGNGTYNVINGSETFNNPTIIGGTRNIHYYHDNMSNIRGVALAVAKGNELMREGVTGTALIDGMYSAITGAVNAETVVEATQIQTIGTDRVEISNDVGVFHLLQNAEYLLNEYIYSNSVWVNLGLVETLLNTRSQTVVGAIAELSRKVPYKENKWRKITDVTITAETTSGTLTFDLDINGDPFILSKARIYCFCPAVEVSSNVKGYMRIKSRYENSYNTTLYGSLDYYGAGYPLTAIGEFVTSEYTPTHLSLTSHLQCVAASVQPTNISIGSNGQSNEAIIHKQIEGIQLTLNGDNKFPVGTHIVIEGVDKL